MTISTTSNLHPLPFTLWQVVLSPEVDGLVVYLPRGFNNIMDNIPFQDAR